jgi:hypothetical protein
LPVGFHVHQHLQRSGRRGIEYATAIFADHHFAQTLALTLHSSG